MSELNNEQKKHKVYSMISSDFVEVASDDVVENSTRDFGWEDSIVDLSDFVPLAELVRSFQPRDNTVEPEFEYPDGNEPDTWNPPAEYSDIADVSIAVREATENLVNSVEARKTSEKSKTTEPKSSELNSNSPDTRIEKAEDAGKKDA